MIHHISITARNPVHVAAVLGEILGGRDFPFTGPLRSGRMAMNGDAHGTIIEVYPDTIALMPGEGEAPVVFAESSETPPPHTGFHALISVPLPRAAIEAIGAREGWRTRFFGRAAPGQPPVFHLIEFWVENRIMLELVTPEHVAEYTSYMQIARIEAVIAARQTANNP